MKQKNTIIIIGLLLVGLLLISHPLSAQPEIDINPSKPSPQDTITVTVNTDDDTIENVYFKYFECKENDVCSTTKNITLNQDGSNRFSKSITLSWSDAAYMQYTVVTKNDQGWNEYFKNTKVTYQASSNNNNNGGDDNDTPGFEFVVLSLSIIFISLMAYRRKR